MRMDADNDPRWHEGLHDVDGRLGKQFKQGGATIFRQGGRHIVCLDECRKQHPSDHRRPHSFGSVPVQMMQRTILHY
jgi:hypothetical protein